MRREYLFGWRLTAPVDGTRRNAGQFVYEPLLVAGKGTDELSEPVIDTPAKPGELTGDLRLQWRTAP